MDDMIVIPPKTIMELYKMLPEGTLAELIEGSIYMSPAPNVPHQRIVGDLFLKLSTHVQNKGQGYVFVSPLDVYLDEQENVVQPDIIFVSKLNEAIVREDAIHGSPDLVIEILSPGNQSNDRVKKKDLYERFGVKEYWIIDPVTRLSFGYILENGVYREFYSTKGNISSKILDAVFEFD